MGPDGHGRYDILDTDDGLLICPECGQPRKHIASHVRAADYRARLGLDQTHVLVAPAVSTRLRDSWERHRKESLTANQTYRAPVMAACARQPATAAKVADPGGRKFWPDTTSAPALAAAGSPPPRSENCSATG